MKETTCPDCARAITETNPLIEEIYHPEQHGSCEWCYDPTPM